MPWPLVKLIPQKTHFSFVRFAFFASFASIALVIASFGSMITAGYRATPIAALRAGGHADGSASAACSPWLQSRHRFHRRHAAGNLRRRSRSISTHLRENLCELRIGEVQVQGFSDPRNAMVRLAARSAHQAGDARQARAAITRGRAGRCVSDARKRSARRCRANCFSNGLISLGLAMLLVMVYIWIRFDLQFGVGAVLSLFHDAILTMGIFSFFRIEFTLPVIAGLLTVIGYSMNDTVVVFDRMRENFRKYKAMSPSDVIDLSINETLSRTLMTIATVLLASLALYLYGGETLRPFAICMLFGVVVATYSSIYIAAPALPIFGDRRARAEAVLRVRRQLAAGWLIRELRGGLDG